VEEQRVAVDADVDRDGDLVGLGHLDDLVADRERGVVVEGRELQRLFLAFDGVERYGFLFHAGSLRGASPVL